MRNNIKIALLTSLVSILLFMSNGSAAFAGPDDGKLDSYYVNKFEKFNIAFEKHIQQLDKCVAEMETFENKDTELVFNDVECSKLHKMRPEAQSLYKDVKALLEEYFRWINSLTEEAFQELGKYSNSSQSMLVASTRKYLTKHKRALAQSERLLEKQVRRFGEMEKMVEEAERKIESRQEDEASRARGQFN